MRVWFTTFAAVLFLSGSRAPALDRAEPLVLAQAGAADTLAPDARELARRLDILAREIDDLRLGPVAGTPESRFGLGPAASKVYGLDRGVSVGGYGEVLYENFAAENERGTASGRADRIDYLRQIVYVGFKYDDHLVFNSEIEFEHATTGKAGSVSVEFGYIDALLRPEINLRGGLLLVPMGIVNELHEPPVFLGALRPETERFLIPSTWRANGAGVFGSFAPGLSYRAYVIESLRGLRGFDERGLRSGRQNGSESRFEDVAGVVRAEYERSGLTLGGSYFAGNAGQGEIKVGSAAFDARTQIYEGHVRFERFGVRARALLAGAQVEDVEQIAIASGDTLGTKIAGSELQGGYVEAGYDVLRLALPASRFSLLPYVRYEWLDTQHEVPAGFAKNTANDRRILTAGAAFYPHPQVVFKGDYQRNTNEKETGVDQWNLALGFLF